MSRAIPWESLDVSALGAEERAIVGRTWRARARQEHLAVGAFSLLAFELAADGCEPVILDLATRAANDEVRHTAVCERMADALDGASAVPIRHKGTPNVPRHPKAQPETRVLLHVVEMCCLSETLTGVYFTEMLARTTDATVRVVIESLLEDEIDHGRLGWAYLATRAREGRLSGLAASLPALLGRTIEKTLRDLASLPDDTPSANAFGWLGRTRGTRAVRHAFREVIVPGFETLGVDLGRSRSAIESLAGGTP
jgi:hypothetical protein